MDKHPFQMPEFADGPPLCAVCGKLAQDEIHGGYGRNEDMSNAEFNEEQHRREIESLQALTSGEEVGECPYGCKNGRTWNKQLAHPNCPYIAEPCPIHGP